MYPPGWILHLEQISEHRPWFDRCLNGCLCLTALLGVGDRVLRPRGLKQKALQNIVVSKAHDLGSFSRSCDGGFAKREATRRILKWKRLTVYFYHNCNVHTFINLLCYTWTRKYGIFRRVQPPDQHEFRLDGPSLNRLPSGLVPSP